MNPHLFQEILSVIVGLLFIISAYTSRRLDFFLKLQLSLVLSYIKFG